MLEDHGEERGADRAADLPKRVDRGGGARHLRRLEQRVGRGDGGLVRGAEAEAADEEHAAQQRVRRVVAHERERHCREGDEGDARDHHRSAADAVGQTAAERQHERGSDALRGKQQAGVERALAAVDLVVEREDQHRAEQHGAQEEGEGGGGAEAACAEQSQLDQRPLHAQAVPGEQPDEREPGEDRRKGDRPTDPAVALDLREAEDDAGQTWAQQGRATPVEDPGVRAAHVRLE